MIKADEPIAHVTEDGRRQSLYDHLTGTAARAAKMAGEFDCAEWGRLAGLWHDLGKYSKDFQQMIRTADGMDAHLETKQGQGRVDHSTAGGIYSIEQFGKVGRILAYLITGHHAGLPDWQTESSGMAALAQRIKKAELLKVMIASNPPPEILKQGVPKEKPKSGSDPALWIRMLFSCLVDADFLDTESFLEPQKAQSREGYPGLSELLPMFTAYMESKQRDADDTPINRLRAQILQRCREMASHLPAIFTLTVPTGGGKTLSSLAFALNHAVLYQKRRIIYVIPYTSIIEQTADQFRKIFPDAVVEHHSNLDASEARRETSRSRLACENWDAPVIVTTSVQFFESLFASRTSRCRKLHNIVNSVVVLDEAQLLPPEFLNPILAVLKELQQHYGVTLVLSTATQPVLGPHKAFDFDFSGLPEMIEIMDDPLSLHNSFKRVKVQVPKDLHTPQTWEQLASELIEHPSVLCIVNRRDDCRELYQILCQHKSEGTIHLSALMCGAHRSQVISRIKQRLKDTIPTRVISTQLVEAGVDVDFPVVYRALAGLDSIAQAAGRCNREGHREEGHVVIFIPPSKIPAGHLRQAAEIGRQLLAEEVDDLLGPERFTRFFKELYWLKGSGLDAEGILHDLGKDPEFRFSFRTAAAKFHLIDESCQAPVMVRYGEGAELIEKLTKTGPERWLLRRLQRYVINLPRSLHGKLLACGSIREISPGIYIQGHEALYQEDLGFCPDKSIIYEPDELLG
ncbi:MAG: CRISPR-associated helicase Cas3' [bacterium]